MVSRDVGQPSLKQDLSLLGTAFLIMSERPSENCLPHGRLRELAGDPDLIDPTTSHHFGQCERCSHTIRAFRGLRCIEMLPAAWHVPVTADELKLPCNNLDWQLFGHLSLEDGAVRWCEEDDWVHSPLQLRITIVIDKPADFIGLTMADIPSAIVGGALRVYDHRVSLDRDEALDILQAGESLTVVIHRDDPDEAGDIFIAALLAGQVSLEFMVATQTGAGKTSLSAEILRDLVETGAIERDFDYELPSGLHCDTHVNVGRLCRSEETLQRVAAAFNGLFSDCAFDTIVTNGWAMATIARRIAGMRAVQCSNLVDDVICDGYQHLVLAGDILPDSRVLVLVDVNVTGTLVERLQNTVELAAGASVAGIGCLVEALWSGSKRHDELRSLCAVAMDIVDPMSGTCRRCGVLEPRLFNPVSQCMTKRAPHPRSPSEFLAENEEARELWRLVDQAHAYEHHRKEENTHYVAFVDTRKLLEHENVGPTIVERLSERIRMTMRPEVLLVPNRVRGQILAKMLASSLSSLSELVRVIAARRMQRRSEQLGCSRPWFIRSEDRELISGRQVLVVDAAAGHGTTVDRLAQLAMRCGATKVGAAVVISRLTETCEDAFAARLSGGFIRLYHLPIRPVLIRGQDDSLCPICQRRAALDQVAEASGVDAIQRWTQQLKQRGGRRTPVAQPNASREVQLALFPVGEQFLENCRESVASGVTLHALNAAMTNGMAPLSLPELFNSRIPTRSRTAMVENLPQGAVEWSGEILADDLRGFLSNGTASNVWRASAEILVKEGANDWLLQVDELLGRLHQQKARTSATFWNHLACTTYIAVTQTPTLTHTVRERLSQLAQTFKDTADTDGVQRVLDTLPD